MIDVRFPTALQIMLSLLLARKEGVAFVSSSQLAEGLNTNPSLVRNILVPLVQAGLVASSMGKHGGVQLAREPDQINLREIYETVSDRKTLFSMRTDFPHRCVVSRNFEAHFQDLANEADTALLELLASRTLAQSFADLEARDA